MHEGVGMFRRAILDAYTRLDRQRMAAHDWRGITTDELWREVKRFAQEHDMLDAILCWDSNRPPDRNYGQIIDSIIRHGELWPLNMSHAFDGSWIVGEEIPF